ncbi:MAG: NAD(P)H-binding protein [Myxococcota bacterium]|nr:NAD(P)H-binding protein [Myxococcota bacterium]
MGEERTRAFVAGASGYTGGHVVRALRARAWEVHAHVRPESSRLGEVQSSLEEMGASVVAVPWNAPDLAEALARCRPSVVFALLGTTRKRMRSEQRRGLERGEVDYMAVDYGLTVMLLRAVEAYGGEVRFVYLSSMSADSRTPNSYLKARQMAEAEIRDSSVPWTIARPGLITGADRPEERPLEHVAGAMAGAFTSLAGALGARSLKARLHPHSGTELGEALVRLALDPAAAFTVVESDGLR